MNFWIVKWLALSVVSNGAIGLFDSCIHGGTKYKEGEFFLPNETIIKTEGPQQCVQCRCRQALVLCEIENCPKLDCNYPIQDPKFCCLRCPSTLRPAEPSDYIFGPTKVGLAPKLNPYGCLSNGQFFENGSVWQPVIGPFGVMACVQCRCMEGNIVCARVECDDVPCSKPKRLLGQCCPVCPASGENKKKSFCLPKTSEVFVFKMASARNNSDKIQYAFLENKWKNDAVKIHTWNLRAKNLADLFTFSFLPRKEFYKRNFHILGSVTKKRLKKYSRKEKKLQSNCFTKCCMKIERLENSLVDYAVNARTKCADDEVDVTDIKSAINERKAQASFGEPPSFPSSRTNI